MYKVLLVDNEPHCIEGLKLIIERAELGFEICGTSGDGLEALKAISVLSPDVVITDIRMPEMDGLALIEQVHETCEEKPCFIILSGYGEFEYAKRAIEYGVKHYILKPIIELDIRQILLQVRTKLDKTKSEKSAAGVDQISMISEILHKAVLGVHLKQDIERLSRLNPGYPGQCWTYIHVRAKEGPNTTESSAGDESALLILSPNIKIFYLIHDCQNFGFVLSGYHADLSKSTIKNSIEKLKALWPETIRKELQIGVGDRVFSIDDISKSYQKARSAIAFHFFAQEEAVVFYEDVKELDVNNWDAGISSIDRIINEIESLKQESAEKMINDSFNLFRDRLILPRIVQMYSTNLLYRFLDIASKIGGDIKWGIAKDISELNNSISNIEVMRSLILKYAGECCNCIRASRDSRTQYCVNKIEKFIKENFKRNITVKELSKELYLHPIYLGQIIISKYGMSFNEVVNQLRIEEACKLLDSSEKTVSEIAYELGYGTYAGFLLQFERRMGLKPTEYKKKNDINI